MKEFELKVIKETLYLVGDFETGKMEKDKYYIPFVVQWGIKCLFKKDFFYYGISLKSFLEKISELSINYNVKIFFHNLGGFDCWFILPYLIKNNWQQKNPRNGKYFKAIITQQNSVMYMILKVRKQINGKRSYGRIEF